MSGSNKRTRTGQSANIDQRVLLKLTITLIHCLKPMDYLLHVAVSGQCMHIQNSILTGAGQKYAH